MCAKWKSKCQSFGEIVFKNMISLEDQYDNELFTYFDLEGRQDLLESFIDFNPEISSIDKRSILLKVLKQTVATKPLRFNNFLDKITKEENNYLKESLKDFVLYTSVSIPYTKLFCESKIEGVTIKFSEKIDKKYKRDVHTDVISTIGHDQVNPFYTFVEIFTKARTVDSAFNKGLDAFDLFRGIWAMFKSSISIFEDSTSRRPINLFTLGPYHTVHFPDGTLGNTEFLWFESNFVFNPNPSTNTFTKEMQQHERKVIRQLKKHNYSEQLKDFIRRYVRAIDYSDKHSCFLELWGLLEKLTGTDKDKQTNYDTTISRTISIYPDWEYHKVVLNHLRIYRNESVHSGVRSNQVERHNKHLFSYIRKLLIFHLDNVNRFDNFSESIEFLNITHNMEELKKQFELRKKTIKFRSK